MSGAENTRKLECLQFWWLLAPKQGPLIGVDLVHRVHLMKWVGSKGESLSVTSSMHRENERAHGFEQCQAYNIKFFPSEFCVGGFVDSVHDL